MKTKKSGLVKKIIIIAIVIIFTATAVPVFFYFYNQYLNIPNFTNPQNNYISVSKSTAFPGEELTYHINIKNEGRRPVFDMVIKTDIPPYTSFSESISKTKYEIKDGNINFFIENLDIDQSKKITYTVKIENPVDNNTLITSSTFELSYKRPGTDEILNHTFPTQLLTLIKSKPDFSNSGLNITDENSEYLRMGDTLKVVLNIKNTGNMNAKDIKIKNIIPQNTSYIDKSFTPDTAHLEKDDKGYFIEIEEVEVNQYTYINYSLRVNSGLKDSTEILFNPDIEFDSESHVIGEKKLIVRAFPDLTNFAISAQDESGGDLLSGDIISYTISVTNSGDGDAYNVVITNPIPQHTSFVSTSLDEASISWSENKNYFNLILPVLEPEKTITYSYRVEVGSNINFGTKISNQCTLDSDNFDQISSNAVANTVISNYSYRVVVMGDSQVAYASWPAILKQAMEQNYPYGDFNFHVSGKGGETLPMGYSRMLSQGIMGLSPYIFIINYGTNDAFAPYGALRTHPDSYAKTLAAMIDTIRNSTGALVVVMSTGPSNEILHPYHTNENLSKINNITRQVCSQKGAVFVDVFTPMVQTGDPNQFLSDGLHYNDRGSQFAASAAFSTISKHLNRYGTR